MFFHKALVETQACFIGRQILETRTDWRDTLKRILYKAVGFVIWILSVRSFKNCVSLTLKLFLLQ